MVGLHGGQRHLVPERDRVADPAADPRWVRQVRFAPIGADGQRRLAASHVLLVGVGALGTHSASHLWRAGVGRLTLVDRDVVDASNLQRQVLFEADDAASGTPKAAAAAAHLGRVRADGVRTALVADFDAAVFASIDPRPDLIVDGTDNFATRYLVNDLAIAHDLPWIYGGVVGSTGRATVVLPGRTPCLRCLMPEPPPTGEVGTCETVGVVAPAVAIVAAFQVAEALKILTGNEDRVTRGTFVADVWSGEVGVVLRHARPRADCESCGTRELPALNAARDDVATLCGRDAVQVRAPAGASIDLARLAHQLDGAVAELALKGAVLRFTAEGCRFRVFPDGRALLLGLDDPARARVLYDRWIGVAE